MEAIEDGTQKMTTLSECIALAIKQGYHENFAILDKALAVAGTGSSYLPKDTTISSFYRFEGYSNPDDNAILYLIETRDGRKGTLVNAYGLYADSDSSDFIKQVASIKKGVNL